MTPSIPAIRRIGLAILVVYAMAGAFTLRMTGHPLRPLYEGIGPSSPYRWVNPPPDFAASNVKPEPATTDIELDAAGSKPAGLSTTDGQVVLNLPAGAIAPRPGDTGVAVTVTAVDPASLGVLPGGLRPNGNAYRVQAAYRPSGTAVESFAKAGNLVLGVPEPFRVLLYSVDGQTWEQLPGSPSGLPTADSRTGYFLGTVESSAATLQRRGGGGNSGVIVIILIIVVLALAFGLGPVMYRRRRTPTGPPGRRNITKNKTKQQKKRR